MAAMLHVAKKATAKRAAKRGGKKRTVNPRPDQTHKPQHNRQQIGELVASAAAGGARWLHTLIVGAGYRKGWNAATLDEVAEFFAVARNTIDKWKTRGCPLGKRGEGYDLAAVARWKISRAEAGENGDSDLTAHRTERAGWNAKMAKLEYQRRANLVIGRQEHEEALAERSAWFVAVLKTIPAKLAMKLAGKSAAEVRRLLTATCRELQALAFGEGEGEGTKGHADRGTKGRRR